MAASYVQNLGVGREFEGSIAAFQPLGKSSWLAASTSTASIALSVVGPNQIQVYNNTTGVCYVALGDSTVTASAGSAGTSTSDYPVAPGSVVVMTVPAGIDQVAAVLSAGSGQVLITPGIGL